MPTLENLKTAERLTRDERMMVYQWSAEGYTTGEICRLYNRSPGRTSTCLRSQGVERLLRLPEAHKFVGTLRKEYLKSIKDIPVTEKRIRLDDLESLRVRIMRIINNCRPEASDKAFSKFMQTTRRAIEILAIARDEMEMKPGVSFGMMAMAQGELSELTDQQLKDYREELIRKAQRVEQRGASSVDENPEGDEVPAGSGSPEILLAASENVQRDQLQPGELDLPDLRQQEGNDQGLSAI